jgi:hypothetical protein
MQSSSDSLHVSNAAQGPAICRDANSKVGSTSRLWLLLPFDPSPRVVGHRPQSCYNNMNTVSNASSTRGSHVREPINQWSFSS